MKNIINTMRFSLFLCFRSPKMVIPILAEALFLFVMYFNTQLPDISDCLLISVHALITMIISFMLPFIFSSNKMNFLINIRGYNNGSFNDRLRKTRSNC